MIKINELIPFDNETPLEFASRLAEISASLKHAGIKQKLGQFFTPADTARFMAVFITENPGLTNVRILDPGTGTAVLSCALIEKLTEQKSILKIVLVCYEVDVDVLPLTELSLEYLKHWLSGKGIELDYNLQNKDFVLDNKDVFSSEADKDNKESELFDFIISNPPFFKLQKEDKRSQIAGPVIFGQPNIYSIFLFIAARLLKDRGELIFLIPRSFCSGNYFRLFRDKLLLHLKLLQIHLFSSGSKLFESSSVLFEFLIVKGLKNTRKENNYEIKISSSGNDNSDFTYSFPFSLKDNIIPLAVSDKDLKIFQIIRSWTGSLRKYGLRIYAGKINRSAAASYIIESSEDADDSIPLFDVSNTVQNNCTTKTHLKPADEISDLFIPNKNYVFLRRYNTNYTDKRVSASFYLSGYCSKSMIAVEKHLVYIDRPEGSLSKFEAEGLAAILNSNLFDNYLRIVNGNINLSIDELEDIPLPPVETINDHHHHLSFLQL